MILDFSDNQSWGGLDLAWGSHTKLQSTSAFLFFSFLSFFHLHGTTTALDTPNGTTNTTQVLRIQPKKMDGTSYACILMCFSFLMQCDGVRYITFLHPADQRSYAHLPPFPFQPHEISLSQKKKKKMQRSPENPPLLPCFL